MKTQEEQTHTAPGISHKIEHSAPDKEAIALRAYFYWEERGCPNDSADEDWFRAEAELQNRLTGADLDHD